MVMPTIRYTISQDTALSPSLKGFTVRANAAVHVIQAAAINTKTFFSCLNFYFINCYFHYERFLYFLREGSYTATATRESAQP